MPKSKRSKRDTYIPPKPTRPKRSPSWVPALGVGLIGLGVLIVILAYVIPGLPGGNANLVIGFVLMACGLVALTQWR
ncbi:hypothetical protein BH23ACT8_BH23ACT8_11300 [soil metagenome]